MRIQTQRGLVELSDPSADRMRGLLHLKSCPQPGQQELLLRAYREGAKAMRDALEAGRGARLEATLLAATVDAKAIERFLDALTVAAGERNDALEDGDRGRGNKALGLILYDDGSGFVCSVHPGDGRFALLHVNSVEDFDSPQEGALLLGEELR